ncbi:MAG: outer membrane lipoprotein carrier protein LolA [Pseudomonadota bacterium]|nr:outer membrane lipoprotein carrier protein LolA [Pseudomonadota bacterium]
MTALLWLAIPPALAMPAPADDSNNPPVTFLAPLALAPHEKTVRRIEDYLSGLTTIASDFTQVAPDGSLTSGTFYLKRPGKMRWQYNPPTPILMVSNGSDFVYYDVELEQVSHIPLDDTLIGFLAQNPIRFAGSVGLTSFSDRAGAIRVTLAMRDKPGNGELTLEFSDNPLLIRRMVIRDAAGQVTTVSLNRAHFGVALDDKMFVFRDPGKKTIH